MKKQSILALLLLYLSINSSACATLSQPLPAPVIALPGTATINNAGTILSATYKAIPVNLNPNSPQYPLPLDLALVSNYSQVKNEFKVSPGQELLIKKNGFCAIPWTVNDIVSPYKMLKSRELPIFVTSDTLLHLYHIQFNEILARLEEKEFYAKVLALSLAMAEKAREDYSAFSDSMLKEAARRNVAYFSVAVELLQLPGQKTPFEIPGYAVKEVTAELRNIDAHQGFAPSAIFNSPGSSNPYQEDYSQYIPRGHYTRNDMLKSYFKSAMWYGRMAFLLKGGGGNAALVAEEDAELATVQAALISAELHTVKVDNSMAKDIWERLYSVTAFFVGAADDLTPSEYLSAMAKLLGSELSPKVLADSSFLLKLKAELAAMRSPLIYGGTGICEIIPPLTKDKLYDCLSKTKGMRLMGQRFVPDSYIFQNLVTPAVGRYTGTGTPFTMKMTVAGPIRAFPRGLDVMAVLGSDAAYSILQSEGDTDYQGKDASYNSQLANLKNEFNDLDTSQWNRNLYWSWLYVLKSLLEKPPPSYPPFMMTAAWLDKQLNTALGSWTELRHDTILYAKQSYTPMVTSAPPPPKSPACYIEPVPEFYTRLLSLTMMTRQGLSRLGALSTEEDNRLAGLEKILERALQITLSELKGSDLTTDDYYFIREIGSQLDSALGNVEDRGKETTLVADVHTDTNEPRQVLEEGLGNVDMLLAAYKTPDGKVILGAGPVLSYYEFKQPMGNRLTNEKWKELLGSGNAPPRPAWTGSYFQR